MWELRQTISCREEHTVFQREIADDLTSPVSSSSEYHSSMGEEDAPTDRLHGPESMKELGHFEGERDQVGGDGEVTVETMVTGIVSLSPEFKLTSTGYSAWDLEFSSNSTAALKLNLVHKWTQKGRIYLTFSMDGKYLATASSLGIVSIFDSKIGKRIR